VNDDDVGSLIANVRFTPTRIRPGYDMGDVDELLDRLEAATGRGDDVTPLVEGAQFSIVKWREGYDFGEVDAFLLRLTPGAKRATPSPAVSDPGVIQEQRGLHRRLFGSR
jgi:DivIVA domain-containing protein